MRERRVKGSEPLFNMGLRVKSVLNLELVEGVEIKPSTLYPRN
jgi:hypothetical protein